MAAAGASGGVRGAVSGSWMTTPTCGGQIWRGGVGDESTRRRGEMDSPAAGCATSPELCGMRVFHQPEAGVLLGRRRTTISANCAMRNWYWPRGARERFLPFPGLDSAQCHGRGRTAGHGEVGLADSRANAWWSPGQGLCCWRWRHILRKHGAEIPMICEQASWSKLARFGLALMRLSSEDCAGACS